jgi:hypothetical protein
MNISHMVFLVVGTSGPFVIWATVYAAAKRNALTLDSMLRVLRVVRSFTWITAVLLWVAYLPPIHLHWFYGAGVSTFSIGLSLPEGWLKQRRGSLPIATPTS